MKESIYMNFGITNVYLLSAKFKTSNYFWYKCFQYISIPPAFFLNSMLSIIHFHDKK